MAGRIIMESMERLIGKNIFVTGGTGFVGSHLVESLLKKGARVIVPARSVDPKSYFYTNGLSERVILVPSDLRSSTDMFHAIVRYETDYVFHLGAQAIVTTAYHDPAETIETNVMGTVNVLEAVRRFPKVRGIFVASSDKAYGKSTKPYTESDPLQGDHPYEVSKSATDLIARSYAKTYGLPVVTTRFGNIYGPGDLNDTRIIPGIMHTLVTGLTLKLRSDGTHVRDFVYVKDVVSGYLFLLDRIDSVRGDVFNFSSDDNSSVLDLIATVSRITQKKIPYEIVNTAKNEIPYQHVDYAKIRSLGWTPAYDLRRAIPETLDWYKKMKSF